MVALLGRLVRIGLSPKLGSEQMGLAFLCGRGTQRSVGGKWRLIGLCAIKYSLLGFGLMGLAILWGRGTGSGVIR